MTSLFFKLFKTVFITLSISRALFAHDGHNPNQLAGHLVYKKLGLHLHAKFLNQPSVDKETLMTLEARDAETHDPVELKDRVTVDLWMPSMGHGSAPTLIEPFKDENGQVVPNKYLARKLYFIMGGEWDIKVTLTAFDGASETASFKILIPEENATGHNH